MTEDEEDLLKYYRMCSERGQIDLLSLAEYLSNIDVIRYMTEHDILHYVSNSEAYGVKII